MNPTEQELRKGWTKNLSRFHNNIQFRFERGEFLIEVHLTHPEERHCTHHFTKFDHALQHWIMWTTLFNDITAALEKKVSYATA